MSGSDSLHAAAIPMQPAPLRTRVSHLRLPGGQVATAINRDWSPGDMRLCRLCDRCDGHDDGCLKLVNVEVPVAEAPLFSTRGMRRAPARESAPAIRERVS